MRYAPWCPRLAGPQARRAASCAASGLAGPDDERDVAARQTVAEGMATLRRDPAH